MTLVLDFDRCKIDLCSWAVSLEIVFSLERFFFRGFAARCASPDIPDPAAKRLNLIRARAYLTKYIATFLVQRNRNYCIAQK
jgi:hypothetical protein